MRHAVDAGSWHGAQIRPQGSGAARGCAEPSTDQPECWHRGCAMTVPQTNDDTWSAKQPMIVGLVGLFLLVGGFGTWAAMTEISGAIIASGRIEVDQNRQVVQHPDGGVVDAIMVKEGDNVEAGEVLLRLDDTQLTSQLAIAESQLFELMARRGRLEAERDSEREIAF